MSLMDLYRLTNVIRDLEKTRICEKRPKRDSYMWKETYILCRAVSRT